MNNVHASVGGKCCESDVALCLAAVQFPIGAVGLQRLSANVQDFKRSAVIEACPVKPEIQTAAARKQGKTGQPVWAELRHQIVWIKTVAQWDLLCQGPLPKGSQQRLLSELRADGCGSVSIPVLIRQFVGHRFLMERLGVGRHRCCIFAQYLRGCGSALRELFVAPNPEKMSA